LLVYLEKIITNSFDLVLHLILITTTLDSIVVAILIRLWIPYCVLWQMNNWFHFQESKTQKFLGVTQFESHFARRCFPCLDEPDRKATFDIKIRHDKQFNARSNMDIKTEEPIDVSNNKMNTFFWTFIFWNTQKKQLSRLNLRHWLCTFLK